MMRKRGWARMMAFALVAAVAMFSGCSQSTMGEKKMMDKEMGKEEMMKDGGMEKKQ